MLSITGITSDVMYSLLSKAVLSHHHRGRPAFWCLHAERPTPPQLCWRRGVTEGLCPRRTPFLLGVCVQGKGWPCTLAVVTVRQPAQSPELVLHRQSSCVSPPCLLWP